MRNFGKKRMGSFFERLTGNAPSAEEENDGSLNERFLVPEIKDWSEEDTTDGELPIDMYQTPDAIIIKTMIAGVKPDDLAVSISREMVTIRGQREEHHESSGDDFFNRELYWGSFSRTILLPAEVEPEDAEAIEKHGLLTIRLPKINKDKTANLRIKSV